MSRRTLVHYAQTSTSEARELVKHYGADEARAMLTRWISRGDSLKAKHQATLAALDKISARQDYAIGSHSFM